MKHHLFVLSLLVFTETVSAAGFYLSEVGTPYSSGTAGVANPTNIVGADASWSNPAGMTELKEDQFMAGFQLVLPSMEFDSSIATAGGSDGGNAGIVAPIPSFFYVKKYSDRLSLGISAAGLMGGGVDYGDSFVGRYSTISAELSALGVSPSLGYKVSDELSVGAGVSIIYTLYEQEIAINTLAPGDGKLKIEDADDFGYQPFFSVNYHLSDKTLLSAVYRAEMDVELEGDVRVKNVALPIGSNKTDIDWDNPQWLELGIRHAYSDKDTLFFNLGWQDWSEFSENQLAFSGGLLSPVVQLDRNWKDTWHAGVAYKHLTGNGWGYSMGFSYDSSPVDDDDRTYDLPVDEIYKIAGSYFWEGKKNLDFSVGGTLYIVGDAKIDMTSQGVRAKGEFDENLILFLGGTLRYVF
jgi:long-chain fatty acid transport protein